MICAFKSERCFRVHNFSNYRRRRRRQTIHSKAEILQILFSSRIRQEEIINAFTTASEITREKKNT